MYRIKTILQYRGAPKGQRRKFADGVQTEFGILGRFWHEKYLPLHFTERAFAIYPDVYVHRLGDYRSDPRPMVESGDMMRQALASCEIATSNRGVRVTMRNLRAANIHNGRTSRYDFKAEITATTSAEATRFARRVDKGVGIRINRVDDPETVAA